MKGRKRHHGRRSERNSRRLPLSQPGLMSPTPAERSAESSAHSSPANADSQPALLPSVVPAGTQAESTQSAVERGGAGGGTLAGQENEAETVVELVDVDKRLSESILWKLQEKFYATAGIEAWQKIPFYPTSNAFIGEVYAELILAFLLDYHSRLEMNEPLYIVELATGTGTFSFYLLKELLAKKAYFSGLKDLKLRYVMTDFAEKIVSEWEGKEQLAEFRDSGVLDFAIFRPEDQSSLSLAIVHHQAVRLFRSLPITARERGSMGGAMFEKIYPAVVYFQDQWSQPVAEVALAGLDGADEGLVQQFEREAGCVVRDVEVSAFALPAPGTPGLNPDHRLLPSIGWVRGNAA